MSCFREQRRRIYRLTCPMLCIPLLVSAAAQQQSAVTPSANGQPGYNLSVTATRVSLDIVVTDAGGHPVSNLAKNDFQIYENKVPQTILTFEPPESHFIAGDISIDSTVELDKKAPDAPVTVIVLDEANTKFEDEAFARYSIQKYLKTQPDHLTEPTELVAIDITHFMVLRDYTTDKQAILNALDHHLQVYPWHLTAGWLNEQYVQSFLALNQVAKAVAGHRGHKNMIWIGHGFPTIDLTSAPAANQQLLEDTIDACTNALRDSRITLYTIDPAGVTVELSGDLDGNDTDLDPFGSSVDFGRMATATGGMALFGRNDVDRLIDQSVRDGNNFYTVTYRPASNDNPNKFRSIRVVIDQPGLTASTREGYYVKPLNAPPLVKTAKQTQTEAGADLLAASENQMVYDGLPIEVREDATVRGRYLIHVPSQDVGWLHENGQLPTTNLSLLVATFDRHGKLIQRSAKILTIHGNGPQPDRPPAVDPAVILATQVDITPQVARIRFVVRSDANGKIGAQNVPCESESCTPM